MISPQLLLFALNISIGFLFFSAAHAQDDGGTRSEVSGGETIPVGQPAPQNTFPSSVRLSFYQGSETFNCSGTLLHERIIITARHCVLSEKTRNGFKRSLSVSMRDLSACGDGGYKSRGFRLNRSNVFIDQRPSNPLNPNDPHEVSQGKDIALILLPSRVPCADIRVAPLYDGTSPAGQIYVAGYGLSLNLRTDAQGTLIARPGSVSGLLYLPSGQLNVLSGNFGDQVFQLESEFTITYRGKRFQVTNPVCQGDSGGSFYTLLANGSLQLAGVIAAYQTIPGAVVYDDAAHQAENCLNFPYAHITGIAAKRNWINAGINQLLAEN